jgi:ferredoxin
MVEWLHGYVYGRWIYQYISIGTGEHPLVKYTKPIGKSILWIFNKITGLNDKKEGIGFAESYHGKVVTLESARQLVTVNEPVTLPDLEKIVPYTRARDIILRNPDQIAAMTCPCRSARETPCTPLDVCLIVGEPFVSFAVEHHPDKTKRITRQEAINILEEESARGHVAHAFFKDAMLDRFYAICNCCSCCCGAMQAQRNGTPMLASSGYVCVVEKDQCIGCGTCTALCQFDAIQLEDRIEIDSTRCMGCGVCVKSCPEQALSLVQDAAKGEPLEIFRLMNECSQ